MREIWLTPQQIATMRLPGMPTHEVSIRRMSQKNLLVHRSKVRGKGIEIALSSLPLEAQQAARAEKTERKERINGEQAAKPSLPISAGGGGCGDFVGHSAHGTSAACEAGAVMPAAPAGESIQTGVPSPVGQLAIPAATGTGGLPGGGGTPARRAAGGGARRGAHLDEWALSEVAGAATPATHSILIGSLVAPVSEQDAARVTQARKIMAALQPLLALPDRHRGRRAMAEAIARDLGRSWQQVYRYEEKLRVGGLDALIRLGRRADRGVARAMVSSEFEAWAAGLLSAWPGAAERGYDMPKLAEMLRDKVRGAWTGGADGERQCWLKATAWMAKDLRAGGCPDGWLARLLTLPAARRFLAAEGQHFRVSGKALRDGKAIYDDNLTPVRRTARALMPGDLVCGDVSPLDIPCLRPDGSTMYARMISWHDVATTKPVGSGLAKLHHLPLLTKYREQWGPAGYRELCRCGVAVREAWNTSKSAHGPWRWSKTPALALALPLRLGVPSLAAW